MIDDPYIWKYQVHVIYCFNIGSRHAKWGVINTVQYKYISRGESEKGLSVYK